eukprot:1019051-Pelagomonas_calceolata.AAC.9
MEDNVECKGEGHSKSILRREHADEAWRNEGQQLITSFKLRANVETRSPKLVISYCSSLCQA